MSADQDLLNSKTAFGFSLRDVLTIVFRHKRVVVLSFLGILTGAVLAVVLHPPDYRASTKFLIERERLDPVISPGESIPPEARGEVAHAVGVEELANLPRNAGFEVSKLIAKPNIHLYPTADPALEFFEASSFGHFLGHLPQELRLAAREELKWELEELRTPEGIARPDVRVYAIATRA